jgi:site-specific DNA-methyltransferase (adenine-specific)
MKKLPDKSVDCFICDLPYGQLTSGGIQTNKELKEKYKKSLGAQSMLSGCSWDVKIDLEQFWTQVKRLAKDDHTPVLMFCNTKFGFDLYNSNPSWFRYDLVWNKARGVSFLHANKMPMKSHEMIYVFSKAGAYYNRIDLKTDKKGRKASEADNSLGLRIYKLNTGWKCKENTGTRCVLSVITMMKGYHRKDTHPTEKPVELYKWLLERYVPTGGTVVDPTAGSFNSIIVAKELGLNGIGIEKDEKFFKTAQAKFTTPELPTSIPVNEVVFGDI